MKLSRLCFYSVVAVFPFVPFSLHATYVLKHGKLINKKEEATLSVQEHYSAVLEAYQNKKWEILVEQAIIVIKNFPSTPFAKESFFYLGVGYFHLKDYELANNQFSLYLKRQTTPKHFEEAIHYKFSIAEKFQKGAKRHVMGWQSMPQWIPAREEALAIYDEVITALPHHDLAAQALFGKAKLLLKDDDYKASVESFQILIRRFPKHPLAVESYIEIGEVYLTQCKSEYPDPDFLDLAEINLRKFRQNFPSEQRISIAEQKVLEMQEIYAQSLYETGEFFERTNKHHASYIYYSKVMAKYPRTQVAEQCKKRLKKLKYKPPEKNLPAEKSAQDAPLVEFTPPETKSPSEAI